MIKAMDTASPSRGIALDQIWPQLQKEATKAQSREPALANFLKTAVISRVSFIDALSYVLAEKLAVQELSARQIRDIFTGNLPAEPKIELAALRDLAAIVDRDPAAGELIAPFLFFKGFHALQTYRFAHWLWHKNRRYLALYLQNRISDLFAVDIHPAAKIGSGIMMDHATGVVIGETAVIEDNVSILHNVTLGGTGKQSGDRHPKIRTGVMIGAGAKILGNIEIGAGARIAAGSVVLEAVPAGVTVAGVPARVIGAAGCARPAEEMDQMLEGATISK